MKKTALLFAAVLAFVLISVKSQAQTAPGFYAGKWDVLIKGTPNGDVHLKFTFTEKDGKLDGSFVDPESKKDVPVTKIETADGKMTVYFTIANYDVNLVMEKVDDTHIKGSLMGMFESTGERVKE